MTYSIAARDDAGQIGIAVQSKFPGVGSIVCHARAGVGAIATQAFANPAHGRTGLDLLERGATAAETITILLRGDDARGQRQIAVLPACGAPAGETGADIADWAGEAATLPGTDCIAAGNSLSNDRVLAAMVAAFESGEGDLSSRLVAALRAGEQAGGELRGVQSAALLVEEAGGGYQGSGGRLVDISVYDHPDPIGELARCLGLHRLSYFPSKESDLVAIDADLAARLRGLLRALGYKPGESGAWNEQDIAVMARFMGTENFDNRLRQDARVDREVLAEVERRYPKEADGLSRTASG